jgi:hypothetical protein
VPNQPIADTTISLLPAVFLDLVETLGSVGVDAYHALSLTDETRAVALFEEAHRILNAEQPALAVAILLARVEDQAEELCQMDADDEAADPAAADLVALRGQSTPDEKRPGREWCLKCREQGEPGFQCSCADADAHHPLATEEERSDEAQPSETCSRPIRIDNSRHSWRFDSDDPQIICLGCGEMRNALSGRVILAGFTPGESDRG